MRLVADATAPDAPAAVGPTAPQGNAGTRTAVPLQAFGVTVGYLTYRSDRRLSASEERLVRDLARRLVEGLRPPALDELGLTGACARAAIRPPGPTT